MIIIGIVGWKNSGKTRLMQGLIKYFSKKNFKVASIKHAHHNFDIDREGTDSFLHRKSGAQEVLISSSKRWAKIDERNELKEMKLSNLIKKIERADIVFVEGFKNENHNKIEILRKGNLNKKPLYKSLKNVIGIVSDEKIKTKLPIFKSKDYKKIYDLILLNK